jgi:hypothetical protein
MDISIKIDEQELKKIQKDLDKLFPDSDTKLRNTLRSALRKSAGPLRTLLRSKVDKIKPTGKRKSKKTGQLKRSIAIINGKTKGGKKPSVYIGPRVKGSYAKDNKTGFYFYFHEYGFNGKPGMRMLDSTAQEKGAQVLNDVISKLKVIIDKRFSK